MTYYVSKHIPVSTLNVIYWDKIVDASSLSGIHYENLGEVGSKLETIATSEILYKILSKIDDMRITVLTDNMDPKVQYLDWINALEGKSHALDRMKKSVKNALYSINKVQMEDAFWEFIIALMMSVVSIFALIMLYKQVKKENSENKSLLGVLNKIATLSPYTPRESEVMHQMLDKIESKEDTYAYIFSSFQLLNEKVKQANGTATSKSDFLATLSHEIRTPLNGIIGFSKLLRDMGSTPDQEEFLSLIEGSSHNLIAIVNDILELSKINADKMEIENISFDIFNTVESTVSVFTYQTDQKDIELALFIDPFLSHYFLGDATKISQILTNLVGNAVKFTNPYGKINIFVQNIYNDDNEAKIKFAVHDNGIGLSEEQIEKIFNPYSQATTSTGKNFGGTGLGLNISRKMVELMGGKLEVKSSVNKGATFFFTLTLKKDKEKVLKPYPHFEDVTVGLALPVKSIKRQLDTNLEIYLRHLGAKFKIYYYEELFEDDVWVELPDIMIFDHHYARLSGELEQCASIDCKSVLLTNGTLHSRVNPEEHRFTDVIYTPITLHKSVRILNDIKRELPVPQKKVKKLENLDSIQGLNALVADDNMINRKLIKIILEKIGLSVTLTENGQEAFDKYKEESYDIIFMDIQMPILDGVESTQKILAYERENGLAHTPIIALTANVGLGDKERYLSEGMDDYATKPLDIETLKRMISKHCIVTV
ncbi:MAG: response regulator [Epsilonproteobacteria bacterium]|nr:response regulator [Campylobacterota bacterium]